MYSSRFFGLLGGFCECKFGRKKRRHLWAFISAFLLISTAVPTDGHEVSLQTRHTLTRHY